MYREKTSTIICFLYVVFFFISCENSQTILPESTGLQNEIVVVFENKNSVISHRDLINSFSTPTKGLSRFEPEFTIVSINKNEFSNIFKTHTNILIINNQSKTHVGSEKLILDTNKNLNFIDNVWSKNQLVISIDTYKKDNQTALSYLERSKVAFLKKEFNYIKKKLVKKSSKISDVSKHKAYPKSIIIPKEYTVVKDSSDFFWAIYNPLNIEQIKHVFVFNLDEKNLVNIDPVKISNSRLISDKINNVLKLIKGSQKDSYVIIESEFPIECSNNTCRGLWRLENGFMGGSFLYKIYHSSYKTTISLGLIFSPNKNKRMEMKKFEVGL